MPTEQVRVRIVCPVTDREPPPGLSDPFGYVGKYATCPICGQPLERRYFVQCRAHAARSPRGPVLRCILDSGHEGPHRTKTEVWERATD